MSHKTTFIKEEIDTLTYSHPLMISADQLLLKLTLNLSNEKNQAKGKGIV